MKVYSIFDSKAEAYLQPFFAVSHGVALRQFISAIQQEDSNFNKFAGDYTLMCIGEFDERKGKLSGLPAHESLGCAIEYLNYSQRVLMEGEKKDGADSSD